MLESPDGTRTYRIPPPDGLDEEDAQIVVTGFIDAKCEYHEGYYDEEGVFQEGRPLSWALAIEREKERKKEQAQAALEEVRKLKEAKAQAEAGTVQKSATSSKQNEQHEESDEEDHEGEEKVGEAEKKEDEELGEDGDGEEKDGEGTEELKADAFISASAVEQEKELEYEFVDVGWAKRGKKRLKREFVIIGGDIPHFYGPNREEQTGEGVDTGFRTTEVVAGRSGYDATRPSRFTPNADVAMPNEATVSHKPGVLVLCFFL